MAETNIVRDPMIAAKERGPGPGRYKLPALCGYQGHDPTKTTMPQYSFGKKLKSMFKDDCSPGPGYHFKSSTTRHGIDGTPIYTILGRAREHSNFKTPSPGLYHPEKSHPQGERHAPAYSMGSRSRYRKKDNTPSPNSYTLPSLLGSKVPNKTASAAYSMSARAGVGSFAEDLAKAPGPGRYDAVKPDLCAKKAPAYSMLGRSNIPGDATKKPGPGAHSPEKTWGSKRTAPKFSLGIRHSEYVTPLIVEVRD